jgi:hypothetical protein
VIRSITALVVLTLLAGCGTPRVMQGKKHPPTQAEFEHIMQHVRERKEQ